MTAPQRGCALMAVLLLVAAMVLATAAREEVLNLDHRKPLLLQACMHARNHGHCRAAAIHAWDGGRFCETMQFRGLALANAGF